MDEARARKKTTILEEVEASTVGKALIDEILRVRTPGLFFRKVMAPKGLTLSTGHHIPCGEFVSFSARHLNHLPEFYQEPCSFDINRFLPPRNEKKAAGFYALQWGAGRHSCTGSRFAQVEILIICSILFEHLNFTLEPEEPELNKSQIATVDKPIKPVYINYRRK